MSEEAEYCICKKAATGDMVGCDQCSKWFHSPCVSLSIEEKDRIQSYICPTCEMATGRQTKLKKRRQSKKGGGGGSSPNPFNVVPAVKTEEGEEKVDEPKKITTNPKAERGGAKQKEAIINNPSSSPPAPEDTNAPPTVRRSSRTKVKHNYSELNDGIQVSTVTKELIVVDYVKMLSKARCLKDDEVPRKVLGHDLTVEYLAENGFREPLIIESSEHLGMKMPPPSITVRRIEEIVGDRLIDVIEVSTQSEVVPKWGMKKWAEYYHTPLSERKGIYNVISLEVSQTPLMEQLQSPTIVRQLDWIDTVWPPTLKRNKKYPQVQYYCLMSVQNSYTDFHIDFAGSSVWYHVLKGEKVFYLIPPTPANLKKYSNWSSSYRQSKVFFGNQVDKCYEAHVYPGQTLFIPTGWIHAVFTPSDSLVFGGNFLHGYNCRLQLEIFEIELSTNVPNKFRFPHFRSLMWYAAAHYNDTLKAGKHLNSFEQDSAKALLETLAGWLEAEMAGGKKVEIPATIRPGLMLRELASALHEAYPDKETSNILKLRLKKEGDTLKNVSDLGGLELMVSAAEHMGDGRGNKRKRFEIDEILNKYEESSHNNNNYEDEDMLTSSNGADMSSPQLQQTKASLSFIVNPAPPSLNNDINNNNNNQHNINNNNLHKLYNRNRNPRNREEDDEYELMGDEEEDLDEIDDEIQTARNNKGDEEWEFVYVRKEEKGEKKKIMHFNSTTPTPRPSSASSLLAKKDAKKMGVRERLTQKLSQMEKRRK